MTNDSAGTPPVPGAELVFPTILGAGPSHVEIAMPDGTVVPAPTVRPVEQEAQVIRPALPSGPAGLQRLDTLDELSAQPDGTVVVWHYWTGWDYERQAGVLDTNSRGEREVRPVSIRIYECNTDLVEVDPPVWVLTFNDPDSASK
ncbi:MULTISPECIES: hypothetical protein [unclassified Mycolicibacterium]|nr:MULTISPECIES: hypothetical protein [unclassified Mycolicibacterium]MUL61078.1 hypothetical protein [Mycolicibacterium sp. CBMA 335]